ncbi:hypothetical protein [Phocaeicola dorei]|nr:hypothetical protein [Phocaeicola dorei]
MCNNTIKQIRFYTGLSTPLSASPPTMSRSYLPVTENHWYIRM